MNKIRISRIPQGKPFGFPPNIIYLLVRLAHLFYRSNFKAFPFDYQWVLNSFEPKDNSVLFQGDSLITRLESNMGEFF